SSWERAALPYLRRSPTGSIPRPRSCWRGGCAVPAEGSVAGLSVLLVSPESTGGIGRHILMLTQGLVERGANVTVCAPPSTLERLDLAATGARVVPAPIGSRRGWRGARATLRALAAEHDITHAHGVRAAAVTASAA